MAPIQRTVGNRGLAQLLSGDDQPLMQPGGHRPNVERQVTVGGATTADAAGIPALAEQLKKIDPKFNGKLLARWVVDKKDHTFPSYQALAAELQRLKVVGKERRTNHRHIKLDVKSDRHYGIVGGPAKEKNIEKFKAICRDLKEISAAHGVEPLVFCEAGTPETVVEAAQAIVGPGQVRVRQ